MPKSIAALLALALIVSCAPRQAVRLTVSNTLGFDRSEVVAVKRKLLEQEFGRFQNSELRVRSEKNHDYLVTQWLDEDGNGTADVLLFRCTVKANSAAGFVLSIDGSVAQPQPRWRSFSRFVPERTDDYAWENDKVAFRTYGPDAQQRAEQHRENGTLSSGIDLWLKRVRRPVINAWYAGYAKDPMFYHRDRGEGYDPYHVGASRGTGGSGIWQGDSLRVSRNFTTYRTIASGPLRSVFELTYESWSEYKLRETKRISLDLGSNFSRFEVSIEADAPIPNYAVGISLHDNTGEMMIDTLHGVFRHWEKIDDSFVGEGLVVSPAAVTSAFANVSETADQSNLLVLTRPENKKIVYYAGFAWQKSGQIKDCADWDRLLRQQASCVAHPLQVEIR